MVTHFIDPTGTMKKEQDWLVANVRDEMTLYRAEWNGRKGSKTVKTLLPFCIYTFNTIHHVWASEHLWYD